MNLLQKNMKNNNRWSILMWSMFLLLFISFSFIYISMWIKTKINQQYDIVSNIWNLNHQNTWTWFLYTLNNSEIYKKYFQNSFKSTLWFWEKDTFNLKTDQKIKISLKKWVLFFSWNSNFLLVNSSIELPWSYSTWIYNLESLSWYTEYEVIFEDGNNVIFPYNFVEIYKNISGKKFLKSTYLVK